MPQSIAETVACIDKHPWRTCRNKYIYCNGGLSVGNIGLGFALPSNLVKQLLPELIETGKIERGWLGITMEPVDQD